MNKEKLLSLSHPSSLLMLRLDDALAYNCWRASDVMK
jgi:hypothetical protein